MIKVRSGMFEESSKSHASPKISSMIIAFICVFLIAYLFEGIIPCVLSMKPLMEEYAKMGFEAGETITLEDSMRAANKVSAAPHIMIPTLISTVFATIISVLYCRFGEMRSIGSMGARKKKMIPHYLLGLAVGTGLMTLLVLLSAVTGVQKVKLCSNINFGLIGLYLFGWFFQGMSEEFTFRGYFMTTLGGKHNVLLAVGLSSAAFAFAHAANPGFGALVFVNLFLFAMFAALYMILFDDIWGCCGIHTIWNFTQGNLYGISVSGTNKAESVFETVAASESKLLTGGDFGIEGSIFTTIVLIGASAFVLWQMKKKGILEITESAPQTEKQ